MIYPTAAPRTVPPRSRAALCALLGLGLLAGFPPKVAAATATPFVVTRTADDTTPGSLRYAISQAAGTGRTITFAIPNSDPGYSSAANTDTITLALGPLAVPASLTIAGPAAPAATVVISGANQSRVFSVTAGTVSFSNLTIQNGLAQYTSDAMQGGGGILNSASLTLTGCMVTANSASQSGGGINNSGTGASLTMIGCTVSQNSANTTNGGGIANSGMLLLTGCTLAGNSAGGASGNGNALSGGGLSNSGSATLNNCTLSNNSANPPASDGLGGGGGAYNSGSLILNGCLVTGNSTFVNGGGIDSVSGTLTLSACTLSGNSAGRGFNNSGTGGGINNAGTAQITNCLIVNNTGYGVAGMNNSGSLMLINSTFTGNTGLDASGLANSSVGVGGLISGPATLVNDIFYFDVNSGFNGTVLTISEIVPAAAAGPTVTSSDVQGGYAGTGNLRANPQFVRNPGTNSSTDLGDEHLKLTSPAVYTGTNGSGIPLTDIEGTPRPAPPAKPSMGAYEIPGSMGFSAQGGFTVTGTQNVSTGAQVVAKFLPGPTPIAGFTATVDTGDGSVVPGIITPDPTASAVSQVTVSHTYAVSGVFPISVTISGPGGKPTATVASSAAIQPVLAALAFPSPVPGGTVVTATVTLSGPALADTVVGLSSSDSSVVRLFRAVTVPAGSSSATFAINTFRSHTTKTVTITAALGAVTLAKDLTITGR